MKAGRPSTRLRLVVATAIATLAALELFRLYQLIPDHHTDFNIVWLGSKALLDGRDPYALVGPGREYDFRWPATYPATALLAVAPLSFLPEHAATILFVWLSTFALAYGVTRAGWYLLPIFATEAFISSVHLGQWSIIMTSGLFIPWLQALFVAKPHTGMSVLLGAPSISGLRAALVGGAVLTLVSLAILPTWPWGWFGVIRSLDQMKPPVLAFGGPLTLLAFLRWRRKESWLILSMALLPQNWGWYATLPLLTVARTFRESASLAVISTMGILAGRYITDTPRNFGAVLIAAAYLPAVLLLLRRPNAADAPVSEKPAIDMESEGVALKTNL